MRKSEGGVEKIFQTAVERYKTMTGKKMKMPFSQDELKAVQDVIKKGKLGDAALTISELLSKMHKLETDHQECLKLLKRANVDLNNLSVLGIKDDAIDQTLARGKKLFIGLYDQEGGGR